MCARYIGAAWLVAILLPWGLQAADETGQTVITSDSLEFDYRRSIAVFEKNVVVEDAQIRMESDRLTVMFDETREIKSVTASGHVRLTNADRTAVCERAVYLAKTGEVVLTGNATVSRGRDSVSGSRITLWIDDERVLCEPGRLVVFPGAGGADWKDALPERR